MFPLGRRYADLDQPDAEHVGRQVAVFRVDMKFRIDFFAGYRPAVVADGPVNCHEHARSNFAVMLDRTNVPNKPGGHAV